MNFRVGGGTGVWDLPENPSATASYNNYVDYKRVFVANAMSRKLWATFQAFDVEQGYDFIRWRVGGSNPSSWAQLSGSNPGTILVWDPGSGSVQSGTGEFNFTADYSVGRPGFNITSLGVCSVSGMVPDTAAPFLLPVLDRVTGVLQGTNDVVFGQYPGFGEHRTFALWSEEAGKDFDLYLRCNAMPTGTQWDYRAVSSDSQEFLDVTGCVGGIWYVAVHSYSGSGVFNLVQGFHKATGHRVINVGTAFSATSTELNAYATLLQKGAKHFFGATEGNQLIAEVDLYNSNGCSVTSCGGSKCDVCLSKASGTGWGGCDDHVDLFNSYLDPFFGPEGFAHELGHYMFCAWDEYSSAGAHCGHSNMAIEWGNENNFCTALNHGKDGTAWPAPTIGSVYSVAAAAGKVMAAPNLTPDNYDYESFDFNALVGRVVFK